MGERTWQPPPLRLLVGLALLALVFAEVQSMALSLRAHRRLRDTAAAQARRELHLARSRLSTLAGPHTPGALAVTAAVGARELRAQEVEILDASGAMLAAVPGPNPVRLWLTPAERDRVLAGEIIVQGPIHAPVSRVLAYAVLAGPRPLIVRVSTAVPDVVADLRERDRLFVAQAVALVVLLVASAAALMPGRSSSPEPTRGALDAYEQAMGRLRDREEEMSRAHDVEREVLTRRMREKETLARAGELTAGIAHEVRNGLGTIVGYARMIERDPAAPGVVASAQSIREECETLGVVVRRFVDYVRDERLVLVPFELQRLLSRVVAREQKDGEAAIEAAPGGAVTVVGDEDMLERALENLVRNARQAAGPGGRVRVGVERTEHAVRLRVSDDGPGLPPELAGGIRLFFTTRPGGLGLGLATVQKIVRLHGGELSFAPELPRGTVAIISLPTSGASA